MVISTIMSIRVSDVDRYRLTYSNFNILITTNHYLIILCGIDYLMASLLVLTIFILIGIDYWDTWDTWDTFWDTWDTFSRWLFSIDYFMGHFLGHLGHFF